MPQSNFNPQIQIQTQTQLTRLRVDEILSSFLDTGHFILTNAIVTSRALNYFTIYLENQRARRISRDCRIYFENVTFHIDPVSHDSEYAYRDEQIQLLLHQLFKFSSAWTIISFENVSIVQDNNFYPLSSNFIKEFLELFIPSQSGRSNLTITNHLIIRNAEFDACTWMQFLTSRPKLYSFTLELLSEEWEDNLLLFIQAFHYAKVKVLEIKNSDLSLECYHALNKLLSKNYFIQELKVVEPTDPEALVVFKKINERLVKDESGEQRFDRERFNQDEFLRLFNKAKSGLAREKDEFSRLSNEAKNDLAQEKHEDKVKQLKNEFKFMLKQKQGDGQSIVRDKVTVDDRVTKGAILEPVELTRGHTVYYTHAEYIVGRLPLFRLDLNQPVAKQANTLGYGLLAEALENNDEFMMNCLLDNGAVNLFEQQGNEKPIIVKIYESPNFKKALLDHIYSRKTLINMAIDILDSYPKSRELVYEMSNGLIKYTKRLEKIIYSNNLSGYERLLNRLRERYQLSNPSKQREEEFIEIYWRIGKSLTQFHNAGKVTADSIANAQSTLDEITVISKKADLGWLHGSKLHYKLTRRLELLKEDMNKNIAMVGSSNNIEEENKPAEEASGGGDERFATWFTHFNLKDTQTEESTNEPGPSFRFFPTH